MSTLLPLHRGSAGASPSQDHTRSFSLFPPVAESRLPADNPLHVPLKSSSLKGDEVTAMTSLGMVFLLVVRQTSDVDGDVADLLEQLERMGR